MQTPPPLAARRFDLGGVTATLLDAGALRLDGGAMFGIIPKALWSRTTPCDEHNRIQLRCTALLLEWSGATGRRALVEVGHGPKFAAKEQQIFALDPQRWIAASLAAADVAPATIADVILTHLHFDHAGGLTQFDEQGAPQATFPAAKVHVQRREFDDARANFGIMTATYREENFTPIDAADAWRLVDGESEIVPGVRGLCSPGHTRGHHSILISGRDRSLLYSGDLLPTVAHAGAPYNMGYDLLPLENRESKRRLLSRAADEDWIVVLDHEPETPAITIRREKDWFALTPT